MAPRSAARTLSGMYFEPFWVIVTYLFVFGALVAYIGYSWFVVIPRRVLERDRRSQLR